MKMRKDSFVPFWFGALCALPLACGGGMVATSRYAAATDSGPDSAWEKLSPGHRIVVSPREGCAVSSGASLADLEAGRVAALQGAGAQLFTIKDSLIKSGSEGF